MLQLSASAHSRGTNVKGGLDERRYAPWERVWRLRVFLLLRYTEQPLGRQQDTNHTTILQPPQSAPGSLAAQRRSIPHSLEPRLAKAYRAKAFEPQRSQNAYLYCASEGLATVVRGSLEREALARALKLRGDQRVILAQTVGYPVA